RYAMGPVWRGENTGHGRYREFWQCDFDIIGTTSNAADVEIVLVINDLMQALGFERFQIRVNNRQVLNGVLARLGVGERAAPILRALDKFDKIGREGVLAELVDTAPNRAGLKEADAATVLDMTTAFQGQKTPDILAALSQRVWSEGPGWDGIKRVEALFAV